MKSDAEKVTVQVGENAVAIRRRGRSDARVAGILVRERVGDVETLWLDGLVHHHGEDSLGEWRVRGAVSSILWRVAPAGSPSGACQQDSGILGERSSGVFE